VAKTYELDTTVSPSSLLARAKNAAYANGAVLVGNEHRAGADGPGSEHAEPGSRRRPHEQVRRCHQHRQVVTGPVMRAGRERRS